TSSMRDRGGLRNSMTGASMPLSRKRRIFSSRDSPRPLTPPRSMARATCGLPQEPLVTPKMEMPAFSHQETTVRVLFSIFSRSMVTCGPGMGLVHINESIRVDLKLAAGNQIGDKLPRPPRQGPAHKATAPIE